LYTVYSRQWSTTVCLYTVYSRQWRTTVCFLSNTINKQWISRATQWEPSVPVIRAQNHWDSCCHTRPSDVPCMHSVCVVVRTVRMENQQLVHTTVVSAPQTSYHRPTVDITSQHNVNTVVLISVHQFCCVSQVLLSPASVVCLSVHELKNYTKQQWTQLGRNNHRND